MIVLLHGLAQPKLYMTPMAYYFEHQGYNVLNSDYPTTDKSIDRLTVHIHKDIKKAGGFTAPKLHFVTHSMGGLVVRSYLSRHKPDNLGRVVMLVPPNKGSKVADTLHDFWLYEEFFGPAGQELTTEARSAYGETSVDFELGVIAAKLPLGKVMDLYMIKEPNDGLVSVESTKIEGMTDHITVNHAHITVLGDKAVWEQCLHFIENGAFKSVDTD
jgi:triacylglycerol esterase/lipase EstA (alpha/beta hydrolase family)